MTRSVPVTGAVGEGNVDAAGILAERGARWWRAQLGAGRGGGIGEDAGQRGAVHPDRGRQIGGPGRRPPSPPARCRRARSPRVLNAYPAAATSSQTPAAQHPQGVALHGDAGTRARTGSGSISIRSTAAPSRANRMAAAHPAAPPPTTRTFTDAWHDKLLGNFDRDRVDRGSDRAGDGNGAAVSQNSYSPSAAQSAARASRSHISPMYSPMCGMTTWCSGWNASSNSFGRTSKPHVSVAIAATPVRYSHGGTGERQARGGPPGVAAPAVAAGPGQLAGPDQHDVAPADAGRLALRGDDRLQVTGGDGEPVRQLAVAAQGPARVEQDSPAGDQSGGRLDPRDLVSVAGHHVRRVPPVPGPAVVEDVAEPVPLGGALQRHEHHVVGAAEAVRETLDAARRVRPGVQHGVHRVGAPPPPGLRTVNIERLRQGKRDAAADQPGALARACRRSGSSACPAHRRHPSDPSWSTRRPPPRSPPPAGRRPPGPLLRVHHDRVSAWHDPLARR